MFAYISNKIIYKTEETKMDAVQSKIVDRLARLEKAIDNHSDKISEFNTDFSYKLFALIEILERLAYSMEDLSRVVNDRNKVNKRK